MRLAEEPDVPRLVALERACFARPWTEEQIAASVLSGEVHVRDEPGAGVVAAVRTRPVLDELEIDTVAVAEAFRRRGLARDLLRDVLAAAHRAGIVRAFLEVRESNHAALALYHGLGFRQVGRRPGYYSMPREDALLLAVELTGDPTP